MEEFNDWDYVEYFTANQAALLIEGKDATASYSESIGEYFSSPPNKNILERMDADYTNTLCKYIDPFDGPVEVLPSENLLPSILMNDYAMQYFNEGLKTNFTAWLSSEKCTKFELQKFSRASIQHWIDTNGFPSKYRFVKKAAEETPVAESHSKDAKLQVEIDPSDFPTELDAANMAFRAVTNGYGDQLATPRNRLVDYLEAHYPDFKRDQVQRIATVANPDKTTGRKKSGKE